MRAAPALRLSPDGSEPAGGRRAAEHQRTGSGVALKDRAQQGHRADLPAGPAGETAEAAGSGVGCGPGVGQRAGAGHGELGGGAELAKVAY